MSLFGAFAATAGCAALMGVRRARFLMTAFLGMVGWAIYILFADWGLLASTFFAGVVVSLGAQLAARTLKCPVTIFLVPSFYPLVPGALLYEMALAFLNNKISEAFECGYNALLISAAIACSIILVETLFVIIRITKKKMNPQKNSR